MQHSGDQGGEDQIREGTRSNTDKLTDQLRGMTKKAANEMLEEHEKTVDLPAFFNPESAHAVNEMLEEIEKAADLPTIINPKSTHAGKEMQEEIKKAMDLPAIINPKSVHTAKEMLEEHEKAVDLPTIFNPESAHAANEMLKVHEKAADLPAIFIPESAHAANKTLEEHEKAVDLPAIINPESSAALNLEALDAKKHKKGVNLAAIVNPKSTAGTLEEEEEQQQEHIKLFDCKLHTEEDSRDHMLPGTLASETGGVHHPPFSLSSTSHRSSPSTPKEVRSATCLVKKRGRKCPITSVLSSQGEEIVSLEPYLKKLKTEAKPQPIMMKKVSPKESENSDGENEIETELRRLELAVGLDAVEEARKQKLNEELEKQDPVAFLNRLGLCSQTEATVRIKEMEMSRKRENIWNERLTRSQTKRLFG